MQFDLIIVGAGAAGLLAAIRAAECGGRTLLLEKNDQTGVKILMSGGTRCNITHATDQRGIAAAFATIDKRQSQFLRSALAALPPEQLIELVEAAGVPTKVEDSGKVFPISNRAVDVRDALLRRTTELGVVLQTNAAVTQVQRRADGFSVATAAETHTGRQLLITSGGQSYPGSGTTGDGYDWARQLGHQIVDPVPALTPITTHEQWVRDLSGLTLTDATVSLVRRDPRAEAQGYSPKRFLDSRRSSLLLTHFGLSGPAALDISRVANRHGHHDDLCLVCNFAPHIQTTEFAAKIRQAGARRIASIVSEVVPRRLADAICRQADVDPDTRAAELSKVRTQRLMRALQGGIVPISGTMGFRKAEVTAGGVSLAEVDSRNMQSRIVDGLYFAGEVLDIDGPIGGFNFQAAFSTGWLAGQSAAGVSADG